MVDAGHPALQVPEEVENAEEGEIIKVLEFFHVGRLEILEEVQERRQF